jgi:hypothetical protein
MKGKIQVKQGIGVQTKEYGYRSFFTSIVTILFFLKKDVIGILVAL